ncbi:MAG: hypothetical protein QE271_08625 [Bacteriovoracaceae bacterium]|nr:hypothetical protein [Bacteriovoracaceae bacterium]
MLPIIKFLYCAYIGFLTLSVVHAERVNDTFRMYICPKVAQTTCFINVIFTNRGIETEVDSNRYRKFTMVDPGGNESRRQCLSFKLPSSSMDARIQVTPGIQCHQNNVFKLFFLDYGSFIGDFEVYNSDGSKREQLRLANEKIINKKNNHWVFETSIHSLGITTSLGSMKMLEPR